MKSKSIRILSVLILLLSIVVLGDGFRGFKRRMEQCRP